MVLPVTTSGTLGKQSPMDMRAVAIAPSLSGEPLGCVPSAPIYSDHAIIVQQLGFGKAMLQFLPL